MKIIRGYDEAADYLLKNRGLSMSAPNKGVGEAAERIFGESLDLPQMVERILKLVKEHGDASIIQLTESIEGAHLESVKVTSASISASYDKVPEELVAALKLAEKRIARFHQSSAPEGWMDTSEGYGELVKPVRRVGIYVPGGTAQYPSTVLMTAVPARIAGVEEIVMCSPVVEDGTLHPAVLVAADIAGVDRIFSIGGAQAIAAMAYGTESVPKVDLICGPGNLFVTLAKKMVYGEVGIDGLYGPTETLIIADETANPTLCAADLLAQAEHDTLAMPVLITSSEFLANQVANEIVLRLERLDRSDIARTSINEQGCVAIVDTLEEAMKLSNGFAPEHLTLAVSDPWKLVNCVKNAGMIFVGDFSHEVLGDYMAGPSHVMPTASTARFNSGLGVHTFLKRIPIVALNQAVSTSLIGAASTIARAEGLTAHAEAAEIRTELT